MLSLEMEESQAAEEGGIVFEGEGLGWVEVEFVEREIGVVNGFEAVEDGAALEGGASGVFGDRGVGFEVADGHGEVKG